MEKISDDERKARQRARYAENRQKKIAIQQKYHQLHPEVAAEHRLNKAYGIGLTEYKNKEMEQKGVCAICERHCASGRKLAVDHDHVTGQVRDLLCIKCNALLGYAKERVDILESAMKYLSRSGVKHG